MGKERDWCRWLMVRYVGTAMNLDCSHLELFRSAFPQRELDTNAKGGTLVYFNCVESMACLEGFGPTDEPAWPNPPAGGKIAAGQPATAGNAALLLFFSWFMRLPANLEPGRNQWSNLQPAQSASW